MSLDSFSYTAIYILKYLCQRTELGRERSRAIASHHKKILLELRLQYRNQINNKQREHRKKFIETLKEHERELDKIKSEQKKSLDGKF